MQVRYRYLRRQGSWWLVLACIAVAMMPAAWGRQRARRDYDEVDFPELPPSLALPEARGGVASPPQLAVAAAAASRRPRVMADRCAAAAGTLERHNTSRHGDICRRPGGGFACPTKCSSIETRPFCIQPPRAPCRVPGDGSQPGPSTPVGRALKDLDYRPETRLCAHDDAAHRRYRPPRGPVPLWEPTPPRGGGGGGSGSGEGQGGGDSVGAQLAGNDELSALASSMLAPWAARAAASSSSSGGGGGDGRGGLWHADADRSLVVLRRLDTALGTRRYALVRLERGAASVLGSFGAPRTPRWARERARQVGEIIFQGLFCFYIVIRRLTLPALASCRPRSGRALNQVLHLASRLAARRPDLSLELPVSLGDCACTRAWRIGGKSAQRRAAAMKLSPASPYSSFAKAAAASSSLPPPPPSCNANYRSAASEAEDAASGPVPIFTTVACLDSDGLALPTFDAGFRGGGVFGDDAFATWDRTTAAAANRSRAAVAERSPRVAFRGGGERSNSGEGGGGGGGGGGRSLCKLGDKAGTLCGRALLEEVAAARPDIFAPYVQGHGRCLWLRRHRSTVPS